jgi:hypothetical protein
MSAVTLALEMGVVTGGMFGLRALGGGEMLGILSYDSMPVEVLERLSFVVSRGWWRPLLMDRSFSVFTTVLPSYDSMPPPPTAAVPVMGPVTRFVEIPVTAGSANAPRVLDWTFR